MISNTAELKPIRFDKKNYIRLRYGFLKSKYPYYDRSVLWRRVQKDWINYESGTKKEPESTKPSLSDIKAWLAHYRLSSAEKDDLKEWPLNNVSETKKADFFNEGNIESG